VAVPVSRSNLLAAEIRQLPDDPGVLKTRIRLISGL
jgi:hypothetical protein